MKKIIYLLILFLITGCSVLPISHDSDSNTSSDTNTSTDSNETSTTNHTINTYFYNQYNDEQKEVYDKVYNALLNYKTEVNLDNCDLSNDEIFAIATQVSDDYPEFFYFFGDADLSSTDYYVYETKTLTLKYAYTQKQIVDYQAQLDTIKQQYLSAIAGYDEMSAIEYTYNYVIQNISYDTTILEELPAVLDSPNSYGLIGALIDHRCVCAGYASALEYLLNAAGYNCYYIRGYLNGDSHAWNAVEINGEYFHFDATSDDCEDSSYPLSFYQFFGLNTTQILKYHIMDTVVPETETRDYNYHVYHNQYITSIDQLDSCLKSQLSNQVVSVQCVDYNLYQQVFLQLINNKGIHNYLGNTTINYTTDEGIFIIQFYR